MAKVKSIRDSLNLFDEVKPPDTQVTGNQLLQNLQSQVNAMDDWLKNINDLSAKGIDQGLLASLREMGPQANDQLKALNSRTSDQLQQYSALWAAKNTSSKGRSEC